MLHITIAMDSDRQQRLANRATEAGCKDVGEFINLLVDRDLADAEIEALGGPPHLTFRTDAELAQLLRERLDDPRPPIRVTPEFWDDIRRRAGLPSEGEHRP